MNWVLIGIIIYSVLFVTTIVGTIIYYFHHSQKMNSNVRELNPKVERFIFKALKLFAYLMNSLVAFNVIWGIIIGILVFVNHVTVQS
jgi:hypothetical protein